MDAVYAANSITSVATHAHEFVIPIGLPGESPFLRFSVVSLLHAARICAFLTDDPQAFNSYTLPHYLAAVYTLSFGGGTIVSILQGRQPPWLAYNEPLLLYGIIALLVRRVRWFRKLVSSLPARLFCDLGDAYCHAASIASLAVDPMIQNNLMHRPPHLACVIMGALAASGGGIVSSFLGLTSSTWRLSTPSSTALYAPGVTIAASVSVLYTFLRLGVMRASDGSTTSSVFYLAPFPRAHAFALCVWIYWIALSSLTMINSRTYKMSFGASFQRHLHKKALANADAEESEATDAYSSNLNTEDHPAARPRASAGARPRISKTYLTRGRIDRPPSTESMLMDADRTVVSNASAPVFQRNQSFDDTLATSNSLALEDGINDTESNFTSDADMNSTAKPKRQKRQPKEGTEVKTPRKSRRTTSNSVPENNDETASQKSVDSSPARQSRSVRRRKTPSALGDSSEAN